MRDTPRIRRFSARESLSAPFALLLLGCAGLVSALVGDGAWDAFSWVALAVPIAVCVVAVVRGRS